MRDISPGRTLALGSARSGETMNPAVWVLRHAARRPDAPAVADGEAVHATWSSFADTVARVAGGRVALALELLSPARRPVQLTSDLESFWSRGYVEVRKELKGRYPKHYWPEDPRSAIATARVRPRD